ncbi:hypothetical protein [uncultured Pontibacter sp.]|uniref:hypothetical protein n=1 Tax=uncultured Pontibacter sp. TaxID=453356 RepID=UPI0026045E07|nr:hypothetical protein [uncultured Pontibacter sp.]
MSTVALLNQSETDFRHIKTLHVFWAGFIIYTVGFTMSTSGDANYRICNAAQLLGVLLLAPAAIRLIDFSYENKYLKVMYTLYCLWLLFVVARGFSLEYGFVKKTLFNPYSGIFLYLAPLIIAFPKHPYFLKTVFNVIFILGVFYLLHVGIYSNELKNLDSLDGKTMLEYFVKTLAIPCGFILLTYSYQPNWRKLVALLVILLTILLATYRARRGLMFMSGSIMIFYCLMFFYAYRRRLSYLFLAVMLGMLLALYGYNLYQNEKLEVFSFAKERLDAQTRSEVELYYYADMETEDWVIGRGIDGLVAAPVGLFEDHVDGKPGYRDGIETDYLTIILKGGIISLGLLLLIAVPAIIQGIFFSKNMLSKAAGIWILLWLVSLYPTTVTTFTLNYLLVWISIGICYSKQIRNIPESELAPALKGKLT